ncbi:MAG: glycosyltransferase family 2 protein [Bacteroidetes bacterium]|nr:MAG: glycosyltransferase family 2 protein [Bacteroidota bacterium]
MKKVSIVICAYNEERTIAQVVIACRMYNPGAELIVVDDGSSDETPSILMHLQEQYDFVYERLAENHGKSYAMVRGVELANNEVILFFDADLRNIKPNHFDQILQPILSGEADMVLGQPSETLINYRVNPFRSLTGERALLKKDLLPILDEIRNIRFGVETYINLHFQANGKIIKYVLLEGLSHPVKYAKTTPLNATRELISESQEIATTLIQNHHLLIKRAQNSIVRTNKNITKTVNGINQDFQTKIRSLQDKVK